MAIGGQVNGGSERRPAAPRRVSPGLEFPAAASRGFELHRRRRGGERNELVADSLCASRGATNSACTSFTWVSSPNVEPAKHTATARPRGYNKRSAVHQQTYVYKSIPRALLIQPSFSPQNNPGAPLIRQPAPPLLPPPQKRLPPILRLVPRQEAELPLALQPRVPLHRVPRAAPHLRRQEGRVRRDGGLGDQVRGAGEGRGRREGRGAREGCGGQGGAEGGEGGEGPA